MKIVKQGKVLTSEALNAEMILNENQRKANEDARNVWEQYDNTKQYIKGNKVAFNGSSYLCKATCRGILPTDINYWMMIASAGAGLENATQLPIIDTGNYYTTNDTNSALQEVGQKLNEHDTKIGDLSQLNTTSNTDLVGAINEVDTNVGDKSLLNTTDKTSLVNAINENKSQLADKVNKGDLVFNVKDYGATGDGVTDDTAAFQNAISEVVSGGGTLYIPRGRYVITTKLNIDLTNITRINGKGVSIVGDETASTIILNKTNSDFAFYVYSDNIINAVNYFRIGKMTITAYEGFSGNKGLMLKGFTNMVAMNLQLYGLDTGIHMTDVLSSGFYNLRIDGCFKGLIASGQTSISSPNDLNFYACTFYGNALYALDISEGCNVNFFGGSIETNGFNKEISSSNYGIKLTGLGRYGSAGATFNGVYFEANENIADVWIQHGDYPATYTFVGCTFNRLAGKAPINHILLNANNNDISTSAKLLTIGCGFRSFSGYIPDASKRVINIIGTIITQFEQSGNYYTNQVDLPGSSSNRIYASARFVGLSTTPALWRGFNISSIIKNATGDYTITFIFPSVIVNKIKIGNIDTLGFVQMLDNALDSIRVKTFGVDGITPIDAGELDIIIME